METLLEQCSSQCTMLWFGKNRLKPGIVSFYAEKCLSVRLAFCQHVCIVYSAKDVFFLYVYLSISVSFYAAGVCLSLSIYLSACLSLKKYVYLSVCQYFCLSVYLMVRMSLYIVGCLFICQCSFLLSLQFAFLLAMSQDVCPSGNLSVIEFFNA